jgi:hypothetical protein
MGWRPDCPDFRHNDIDENDVKLELANLGREHSVQ